MSKPSPIEDFSVCHVGILAQLDQLTQLPALLDAAARARHIASATLDFFRDAVLEHHQQEESELFPAVLASAGKGAEQTQVADIVHRLVSEHRQIEAAWAKLEPGLKSAAKGQDSALDAAALRAMVTTYQQHAQYEEQVFLPLSQQILGRNPNHLAALGMSLHMRHTLPEVMRRFGSAL